MHTITAHRVCAGASESIAFCRRAFDATELRRLAGPQGKLMRARLRIGAWHPMLVDEVPARDAPGPKALGGTAVKLHTQGVDVDAACAQAVAAGAGAVMPTTGLFGGVRCGLVQDPWGRRGSIASNGQDLTPAAQDVKAMRNGE